MLLATLHLNKQELELSREEIKKSSEALKSQADTLEKQRFEDTFFALLEQHRRLLEKSNSVAEMAYKHIVEYPRIVTDESQPKEYYGMNHRKKDLLNYPVINQYFRFLYQILQFVASNCPDRTPEGEKLYSNIVRSFLTDNICTLLAINCYCEDENSIFYKYKLLVERYSIFEHMNLTGYNENNIREKEFYKKIKNHYCPNAFGKNAPTNSMVSLIIKLDDNTWDDLKQCAEAEDMEMGQWVKSLIGQHIQKQ